MKRIFTKTSWRILMAGSVLLTFGGCGLSDTQLTSIVQSLISTGLNAVLAALLSGLLPQAASA